MRVCRRRLLADGERWMMVYDGRGEWRPLVSTCSTLCFMSFYFHFSLFLLRRLSVCT